MLKHLLQIHTLFLCILFTSILIGKTDAQIFPGLVGEELVAAIQQDYTPGYLLNETEVKDTLYAVIFNESDSVKCIYSGLSKYLPQGVDPSQYLFGTGLEAHSINLEHSWPQAKGAGKGTRGNTDMHHLYPSRTEINSDRGNLPYLNSPDHLTQSWYLLQQEMPTIPGINIDLYSELGKAKFEPRESVKGDIARAFFYFWTIYRVDAENADPDFFEIQRDGLCSWHVQDPPDELEMTRNSRIAIYQDGKVNPFILDCSLATRAYCPQQICMTGTDEKPSIDQHKIYFDAGNNMFRIVNDRSRITRYYFSNTVGQLMESGVCDNDSWTSLNVNLTGLYFLTIAGDTGWDTIPVFLR